MIASRTQPTRVIVLALVGGTAFWLVNLVISLTPLAAAYRLELSIAYVPMLVQALAGGLAIGSGVAFALVRRGDRGLVANPLLTSLVMSVIALIAATLLIEVPAKILSPLDDPLRTLLVATLFNTARILALGLAIGLAYRRLGAPVTSAEAERGRSRRPHRASRPDARADRSTPSGTWAGQRASSTR